MAKLTDQEVYDTTLKAVEVLHQTLGDINNRILLLVQRPDKTAPIIVSDMYPDEVADAMVKTITIMTTMPPNATANIDKDAFHVLD